MTGLPHNEALYKTFNLLIQRGNPSSELSLGNTNFFMRSKNRTSSKLVKCRQQKTRKPFDLRIIVYLLGFYEQMT